MAHRGGKHVERRERVSVEVPPCVHGSGDVAVVGSGLELGDNDDDEGVGGNAIVQREDCVVSQFYARHGVTISGMISDTVTDFTSLSIGYAQIG